MANSSPSSSKPSTEMISENNKTETKDQTKQQQPPQQPPQQVYGNVIMTSQKHQDHRIDILLKKQMVAGREIGLLRQALLELETLVVKGSKISIGNNDVNPSGTLQIEDAVEQARRALIGVATEANEAMKRVVAQTSRVEAYVRKHDNEERRLRAEQEYKHLKEVQQMQRLNKGK
jgi:hypothetical protein